MNGRDLVDLADAVQLRSSRVLERAETLGHGQLVQLVLGQLTAEWIRRNPKRGMCKDTKRKIVMHGQLQSAVAAALAGADRASMAQLAGDAIRALGVPARG